MADTVNINPNLIHWAIDRSGLAEEDLLEVFPKLDDWTPESLTKLLETRQQELNVSFGRIAQPIRVALSGTTVSPQIVDTLILLGRGRTIARIKRCSTQCAS